MTPYRQLINPGDTGLDVLAVKRALKTMKIPPQLAHELKLTNEAGGFFVDAVQRVQSEHRLKPDGLYGKGTHGVVAPHFDRYGDWLYRHAAIRTTSVYRNPFEHAQYEPGRIDMGVDYHGIGPIAAIGEGVVIGNGGGGWPGSEFLLYRLLKGPHALRFVYLAEGIVPLVRGGEHVAAGQTIAHFRWDAAPGRYPGIEHGWGTATLNETLAAAMGQTGGAHHSDSPAGLAFARFLRQLGTRVSADPGPGPTYPT